MKLIIASSIVFVCLGFACFCFAENNRNQPHWVYPSSVYDVAVYGTGDYLWFPPQYYDSTYYSRGNGGFSLRDEKVSPGFVIRRKKRQFFSR